MLIVGAYLVGFLSPLVQVALTAQSVYLAATLPAYVRLAGDAFLAARREKRRRRRRPAC